MRILVAVACFGVGLSVVLPSSGAQASGHSLPWDRVGVDAEFSGEPPLLHADFNAHPVGQPVGQGGAANGEPESVPALLNAVISDDAFPTPALDISWAGDPVTATTVGFGFLGQQEVVDGLVDLKLDVIPRSWSQYNIYLREQSSAARAYSSITIASLGGLSASDRNGQAYFAGNFWSPGSPIQLHWRYDMDHRVYWLWINGTLAVSNRQFGVAADGRGIGRILVGMAWNTPSDSLISVDNVSVRRVDDIIFADPFDNAGPTDTDLIDH